ncbi:MAG: CinA family protein [Candidatus Anaerobiospirillum merdipullorum]|uniref:CinA family protein n=1 Tax=Candidatus Anaerobiospirillum merdipullorum TaxID=2838450 RepID=A0A9E2KLG2_9GAMM|nr:CinA family protein [Candidatus Anaerobiospirillum merdipullorum]
MQSAENLAQQLQDYCLARKLKVTCAESCTGGLIAATITAIPGSSGYFERSFVTYCNAAKHELLGVEERVLVTVGAVSEQTAKQMAQGALMAAKADMAVGVTGIAGPDGGSALKPVGTVWIGWCVRGQEPFARCFHFKGNRAEVRAQSVEQALMGLISCAKLA